MNIYLRWKDLVWVLDRGPFEEDDEFEKVKQTIGSCTSLVIVLEWRNNDCRTWVYQGQEYMELGLQSFSGIWICYVYLND
ncbi:hypothetical protein Prudu_006357 [Prunus dulcis]|uniref:Uncharacterized protein n=1 Tax=Prunus dulcis TaxID=3755 RepID=A0A4Y1QZI8_PRUDU|nr:hypothetical protein Prudu_006357 [Prunus dulcis]